MTQQYLISLGSNIEPRQNYLDQAYTLINQKCGTLVKISSTLETKPIGPADGLFLNTVIELATNFLPENLLGALQSIESALGRVRQQRWGNRTIDLDIILWRDSEGISQCYQSKHLIIPHPEFLNRYFVLNPAAEIAGDWLHPLNHMALRNLRSVQK